MQIFKPFQKYINNLDKSIFLQVFLPINITKFHWYLAVVNASEGEIHVLDSFGENMTNWTDLKYTVNKKTTEAHTCLQLFDISFLNNFDVSINPVNRNGKTHKACTALYTTGPNKMETRCRSVNLGD